MRCFAVVVKIGEIFAEFGYSLDSTANAIAYSEGNTDAASDNTTGTNGGALTTTTTSTNGVVKWQLRVMNESHDLVTEEEVAGSNASKVIKVSPSTIYLVQTRVLSEATMEWCPWSEVIRTRTFSPVKTSLQEIGEDYVRLQWDRPLRDTSQIAPEVNAEAVRRVAEVSQFCLRVVREVDMYEVFNQEFAVGTRTYTLHNLRPGTAHIVYTRYRTLIGTLTNWSEVSRFYTQNTFELALTKRGEDTFTVKWDRQSSDVTTIGYVMPDSAIHRFELSIVGEGLDIAPLEISSAIRDHTFKDLVPASMYRVRVRCLTKDGRWGVHSKVLKVTLAERPMLHPIATGETFMSFTWQRTVEEPQEQDIEWHIRSASSDFEATKAVFIRKGAQNKKFTIESLVANTIYFVRVRTFLMGEWGLWSEPFRFVTAKSMSIQLLERGENFFTVTWPIQSTSADLDNDNRFELVLVRLEEETDDREIIMQEEVIKDSEEGYRLQNLLPNTTYELRGRAWQRNRVEGTCMWGQYSNTLRVRTLQNVALRITSIGEDFAELSWTRALALRSGNENEELWKDLKYEVIVGCVDTGEDGIVHREIVDTTCTIDKLLPSTTYTVSVRACDDREQWGAWSHARFHTLAAVQTSVHEIGETFVRIMWRRENGSSLQELMDHEEQNGITDQPPILKGDPVAKEYTLFVYSNDYDNDTFVSQSTGYPRGGNSEVSQVTSIQSHHSSFRVCDLLPDRTYTAVIRAATPTGRWGIWSQEVRFHTTAPFRIPVNTLHVGENYIHLTWNRDERPTLPKDVLIEDPTVVSQQIRFRDIETNIAKEITVSADVREEKLRGLRPATGYCVQIRACNKSGEWGQWSTPVTILTRATIICKDVEIAEDYVVVKWDRPKAPNPHNYATGKGTISSYEIRVTNKDKPTPHLSTFIIDSPFKIPHLLPNTYYCVEMKANYNDEEWGMWSTPLWCLTMPSIQTVSKDIGEEHCTISVKRPLEEKTRMPEDDGNRSNEFDRILAFGRTRPRCQLCVTTAKVAPPPHAPKTSTFVKGIDGADSMNLPPEIRDDKIIYLTEVAFDGQDISHTIPNLKANTVYSVVARSRLDTQGSDWGMWSTPTHRFITVAMTEIEFLEIGEAFVTIKWQRGAQDLAGVVSPSSVARGSGSIARSKIKIRDSCQHFTFVDVDSDVNTWTIPNLKPAETYGISIQIMGASGEWGVWSTEAKVRTVPPMTIAAENIAEDAVWLSWVRESDLNAQIGADTCMNVDTTVRKYELSIRGEGGFSYTRIVEDGNNCFFRGLQPDTIYEAWLRTLNGLWSKRYFATLPTIRVTFGNIGEHFAVIEWRRNLPACLNKPSANGLAIAQANDVIEKFCLRVELPGEDSVLYELPANVGTYRLRDMKPSSEYRIWVCAQGFEGVWGLWNTETRVRTLPQLDLAVDAIGEDYVSVSWVRNKWNCTHPTPALEDPEVKTWEIHGATTAFQVEVLDENDVVVGQATVPYTTTKCTIGSLKLKSTYTVCVRAKDTYDEWGLWSDPRLFVTLQPVQMNILRIGENFVQLEWERRTKLRTLVPRSKRIKASGVKELPDDYSGDDQYEEEDEEEYEGDYDEEVDGEDAEDPTLPAGHNDMYPVNAKRGNEDVQQWAIRVYGSSVFGGQPGSETDFREFFSDSLQTSTIVGNLHADHVYTIGIRARNSQGEWGQWSVPVTLRTQPLIKASVLDISETTMRIGWQRPSYEPAVSGDPTHLNPDGNANANSASIAGGDQVYQFSFPDATEAHNYQISIQPLEDEAPFPPSDEHVVDGARVYETSQPSLHLVSLVPGTRYRVIVREQMLNEDGTALWEDMFGVDCEPLIVETILPMEVLPVDIGENQTTITWRRRPRTREADSAIAPVRSTMRTAFYQVRVARMDADGVKVYEGSMALALTQAFRAPESGFLLNNLSPNAVYAVCVQAQLENGVWGPWSGECKFVTLRRLTLCIDTINQDSLMVSWLRQGPDWMPQRLGGASTVAERQMAITAGGDESNDEAGAGAKSPLPAAASSMTAPQSPLEVAIYERDRAALEQAAIPDALRNVVVGDYLVKQYEIIVEGVTCQYSTRFAIDGSTNSTKVPSLSPNHVYCAYVRSMSHKDQWSLSSPRLLVCTLNALQLQVGHYTECNAMVAWFRPPQTITPHEKAILKVQKVAHDEADLRERQARFDRQQLIQIKAENNETPSEEELAMSALLIEQAAIDAEEALHFLAPENVHMGLAEVSGYQVRLYGEGGMPVITGNDHLLPTPPKAKTSTRRRKDASATAGSPTSTAGSPASPNTAADEADGPDGVKSEQMLLDVKINPKTAFVKITGLKEGTSYDFCIRSRNAFNEWGPWSPISSMQTLELLKLAQSRFGEHYISLYWHRPSIATVDEYTNRKALLSDYSTRFKTMSVEVLEQKKREMSPTDYAALVEAIRDWRAQQRWVADYEAALANGGGEVLSAPDMPIKGYHLRILNESGQVTDKHFEGDVRQHTLTGLTHNAMYVVLMCADYGNGEWGSWSQPLKVMTQNTIQLNISYVGETFIDATWKRAPNKKPNPLDADSIIIANPAQQGTGRQFEASLRYVDPTTGEERDDRRQIEDASSFRLDKLHCDTHYKIKIREWDAKGEWGMWGTEKRCVTLAGMKTHIVEIAEDWVDIKWGRLASTKRMDYDDPAFVQRPVENICYYLQVVEVPDDATTLQTEDEKQVAEHSVGTSEGEDDVDIGSFLEKQAQQGGQKPSPEGNETAANRIPKPPTEHEPNQEGDAIYKLVKRFDAQTHEFRIDCLCPDKFYKIQLMCETTGGQLGSWSPTLVALTVSKIKVRCDLIDELVTRVSWTRDAPRKHPTLKDTISPVVGICNTKEYQLIAKGIDGRSKDYSLNLTFNNKTHDYKLEALVLNGCYVVRVRAVDVKKGESLWSEDANFVTLKRLKVHAYRITETSVHLGWGRDEQVVSEYPATSTPLHIAVEKNNQYHINVFSAADLETPIVDRLFAGTANRFVLPNLDPNNAYVIRGRASNVLGEWSLWSEDRVVYTMKTIVTNVVTVGENYIAINWTRDAPDELADVIRGVEKVEDEADQAALDLDSMVEREAAAADNTDDALKALQMRKRFPLIDRPATPASVYVSARTEITQYCVSISRPNENTDPWTAVIDGQENWFKIPDLRHDTVYEVSVRACYGDGDWGVWSEKVLSGTTNLLQINVKQVGEDYLAAEWRRGYNSFPDYGMALGKAEDTMCYQFRIHDYTEVPIGGEGQVDADSLLTQDVLLNNKNNVFKHLTPNRRYQLTVRRWYKPADLTIMPATNAAASTPATTTSPQQARPSSGQSASVNTNAPAPSTDGTSAAAASPTSATAPDQPAESEEVQIKRQLEAVGALEGCWSDPIAILTLKQMVVLVSDISEGGMVVRWERDPEATALSTRQCVRVNHTVNFYHLRIDEMTKDGSMIDSSPQTLHFDREFQAEDVSFRVKDLKPDAVYRIDVRCRADKVWGLWSRHVLAITLPRLQVTVTSIGEDYASLAWERKIRFLTAPDGTEAITGNNLRVEKYELEMRGLDHHFELPKRFKATRTTYKVKNLEPSHVYSIVMRSCDSDEEWSVWSDRVAFATLKPLQLNFGKIAEQFVHVNWNREPQTSQEYNQYAKNVIIGPTDALSYHFCVFAMGDMPSAAIIDKQFRGDVNRYRVEGLTPNTSYIMIARACNTEQQWGLWGEERIVTTQSVLATEIFSIGENYVSVKWGRADPEADRVITDPKIKATLAKRKQPTSYHLCLTSEADTIDRKFTPEECTYTADESRTPMYTVRGLRSDSKYIMSLQACYGDDEWGTWSAPITFLSLSNISVKVANITESSAEFMWGRAQQNPTVASDPNVLVWRSTIVRYQLLLRKVDEMRAQEMREREQAMAEEELQQQLQQMGVAGASINAASTNNGLILGTSTNNAGGVSPLALSNALVPTMTTDGTMEGEGVPMHPVGPMATTGSRPTTATNNTGAANNAVPHFFFEQEMDVRLVKYVQTLSRIDRLEVNTEYHFQVRALDDRNEWGYWSEVFFDTPPNPPQNLIMRKDGAQLLLSWDPPSRQHNYMYCIEQAVGKDPTAGKEGGAAARATKKDGSTMDWRVVDTVEDTVCRMRAFGPINRVRCRIKCCKVNTPTYLFSRYSAVVTVTSNNGIEPVADLHLTTLSKSTAVVEWAKAEVKAPAPEPGSPITPAPPAPRVAYRVMLGINNQPLINVATLRATVFELTELSPSTNYVLQVITETENGSCQRNATLRFTTKAESDRGVYKAAPNQPPLGDLTPAPQDRTLQLLNSQGSAAGGAASMNAIANGTKLPALDRSGNAMTPRPPASKKAGSTPTGGSTPRGTSSLATPATQGRRPPGTAPHGATRSGSTTKKAAPPRTGSLTTAPLRASASAAAGGVSLPPVGQRVAASGSGSKAVEHFDYVGFVPSDDEK